MSYTENDVVQTFMAQSNKNEELLAAIALFRYRLELQWIEAEIEENKPMRTQSEQKVKRFIIDNTVNAYRRGETQRLSEKKRICEDRIRLCQEKHRNLEQLDASAEGLKSLFASAFEGDSYGMQKTCFAMLLCLQNDPDCGEYFYGDDSLKAVSSLLFGDEWRINNIKEKFYENFKLISHGSFWERNRDFFIGAGISLALVAVLTPLTLGVHAAGSAVITSCLAQIGHAAPGIIGGGLIKVTGMALLGSALFGGAALAGIGIGELIKTQKTKEAFRALKPNDVAALFSMKATLFDFGKTAMDSEACKRELDACLAELGDFRADAEYMLVVERADTEDSRKKIEVCNRFVNRLAG